MSLSQALSESPMPKSRRLQRELAIAREERDILKKAIQVFSQEGKR